MAYFQQQRLIEDDVRQGLRKINFQLPTSRSSTERVASFFEDENYPSEREPLLPNSTHRSFESLPGISVAHDANGDEYFRVGWDSPSDRHNPRNWSLRTRISTMILLDVVASVVTAASSIDSAVAPQAASDLGVSREMEALSATGLFLIGFGLGALLAAPASEMMGRHAVYLAALIISAGWMVGAALAPDIIAQMIFRFLTGFFSSAPLTVAGGSMGDMWNTRDMTWAFPVFAIVGFGGPVAGPIIAACIGSEVNWRWAEWIMLIAYVVTILLVLFSMQETYAPRLLHYKAREFRRLTGIPKFMTVTEAQGQDIKGILRRNYTRPWLFCTEPIVICLTIYASVSYVVLYTSLIGYPRIFRGIYGLDLEMSNLCFLGLLVGILSLAFVAPFVMHATNEQLRRDGDDGSGKKIRRELRLIFAMIGAPAIPIGLLWMSWTAQDSISIWSPLAASIPIGFGTVCIFVSSYTYIIDSYQLYAASALTFMTLIRYVVVGIMTVIGNYMYDKLGIRWSMTLLGIISALIAPVPYVLYHWGPKIRAKSQYAVA